VAELGAVDVTVVVTVAAAVRATAGLAIALRGHALAAKLMATREACARSPATCSMRAAVAAWW
jgi:hypothetical protein